MIETTASAMQALREHKEKKYNRKRTRLILDVTTNYPVTETDLMHAMGRVLDETLRFGKAQFQQAELLPLQQPLWASNPRTVIEKLSVSCYSRVQAAAKVKARKKP